MTEWRNARQPGPAPRRPAAVWAVLVFTTVLTLCLLGGTGAFFFVQNSRPAGAAGPGQAIDGFLSAIFKDHDPALAETFVCGQTRGPAERTELVDTVAATESGHPSPRTTWSYPPIASHGRDASAVVTLTLTSQGASVAEKQITVRLVEERGWWVCTVEPTR